MGWKDRLREPYDAQRRRRDYLLAAALFVLTGLLTDWYIALGTAIGAGIAIGIRMWWDRKRRDTLRAFD